MAATHPIVLGAISSGYNASSGATMTFSHTVVAGTEALYIFVAFQDFSFNTPELTYGGEDVPLHIFANFPGPSEIGYRPVTFRLLNPPVGTADIEITPTPPYGQRLAGWAVNFSNYGGPRFADWHYGNNSPLDPPTTTPEQLMYCEDSDLIFTWVFSTLSQTFTPDVNQTLVLAETTSGMKQAVARRYGAAPEVTTDWTLTNAQQYVAYIITIKGQDHLAPAGAPANLGPVSNTMTIPVAPAPGEYPSAVPPPGEYWKWPHTILSTHQMLVVMIQQFQNEIDAVSYGGVALTLLDGNEHNSIWVLETAAVGTDYIEVQMNARWSFTAAGYSLRTGSTITGTAYTQGVALDIDIPSVDGATVIGQIEPFPFEDTEVTEAAGQTTLYGQPYVKNSGSETNATPDFSWGSFTTATSDLTNMSWTVDPEGFTSHRVGFSFISPDVPDTTEVLELIPRRQRRTPHLSHEQLWTFYHQLQVDVEAGLGLTTGQGSDPQIMLRWSDDGGHTWSNEHWVSAGPKGQYAFRAMWRRLGRGRDRVFEITVSDPIAWNLIAAYLQVEGGTS